MDSNRCAWVAVFVFFTALGCRAADDAANVVRDVEFAVGNVPENIVKAAQENFQVSKFISAEKRTCNKKIVHFELEMKLRDKTTIDAYFDPNGKLLRTGVSVVAANIPPAVQAAFNKLYADWTVTECNKETDAATKQDVYSIDINKGGKQLEVDIAPDGTIVKTLELKDED